VPFCKQRGSGEREKNAAQQRPHARHHALLCTYSSRRCRSRTGRSGRDAGGLWQDSHTETVFPTRCFFSSRRVRSVHPPLSCRARDHRRPLREQGIAVAGSGWKSWVSTPGRFVVSATTFSVFASNTQLRSRPESQLLAVECSSREERAHRIALQRRLAHLDLAADQCRMSRINTIAAFIPGGNLPGCRSAQP